MAASFSVLADVTATLQAGMSDPSWVAAAMGL